MDLAAQRRDRWLPRWRCRRPTDGRAHATLELVAGTLNSCTDHHHVLLRRTKRESRKLAGVVMASVAMIAILGAAVSTTNS